MTRSQLVVKARKPRTPLMITTVNVTSTSQAFEATITGSRGIQNPPTNVENVDLREYHFNSEEEHITTTDWQAQLKS